MSINKRIVLKTLLTASIVCGVFGSAIADTLKKGVKEESSSTQEVSKHNITNTVVLKTNLGDIVIELDAEKAPKSTANFQEYVASGFYNGTIFHRTIPNFMVQGGGFGTDMKKKETNEPIQNEADNGLKNSVGSVAMARTGDPHSATSQFFINVVDNGFLDHKGKSSGGWGYAVIGQVIEGMNIVDGMSKTSTKRLGAHANVPIQTITIEKASFR